MHQKKVGAEKSGGGLEANSAAAAAAVVVVVVVVVAAADDAVAAERWKTRSLLAKQQIFTKHFKSFYLLQLVILRKLQWV
jgi:hypothetical protein